MKKIQKNVKNEIIKELGPERVLLDELMAKHTTFKIGGPVDLFYSARSEEEIVKAVTLARKLNFPYFILGNGSNLLVGDRGFRGLVIKYEAANLIGPAKESSEGKVVVEAGALLSQLVEESLRSGWGGLEFLVGIPGSVGGAVRGNAGAWQKSIADLIYRVKILDESGKVIWLGKSDCRFSYRQSRFKISGEIILAVELILIKKEKKEILKMIEEYTFKRNNQPKEASAGCVFINPKPYSAGEMIQQCGLRGKKVNQAQISLSHANFIVNLGKAKAEDVLSLMKTIKEKVKERFGTDLREEIVLLGDF